MSRDATPMSSPFVDKPSSDAEMDGDSLSEQVSSLEYQLNTEKGEREREKLWYEQRIREYEHKVKTEGKRADELESNQEYLYNEQKETLEQLEEIKEGFRVERGELEKQLRQAKHDLSNAENQKEEIESRARSQESFLDREVSELRIENETLQQSVKDLQTDVESSVEQMEAKQTELLNQESELNRLKETHMKMDSNNDDKERLEVVERELSQRIEYTHELEQKIADQKTKIEGLEESSHMLQIVEESKAGLEAKLEQMDELRQRAVDAETRIDHLAQEKTKWTSYLEKDDKFNTPEDVVRALMRERVEKIGLLDRLGRCEAELSAKDVGVVEDLSIKEDLEEMKAKYEKEANHRARLQRQKELTARECSFLRDQLASYDTEDAMQSKDSDQTKLDRIKELEQLLDESRAEQTKLGKEIAEKDGIVVNLNSPKRKPRQSDIMHDERLSEALRKVRNLQAELEESRSKSRQYEQELGAVQTQLDAQQTASSQSQQRVLELRNNPTHKFEKVKLKSIEALRAENEELISKLNGSQDTKMVPITVVDRVRTEVEQLEKQVQEQKKSKERLSKVYQKLSTDLRQTVYALIGYQVDPLPNKKVRVKSIFSTSEDESLTFVPDPNSKVPKFVGIDDSSAITTEYENLVTFWVKERKDIPCFLAALNLELYDKTTKAARF